MLTINWASSKVRLGQFNSKSAVKQLDQNLFQIMNDQLEILKAGTKSVFFVIFQFRNDY